MSVKIRLARQGAKKSPFYRIVAADTKSPRDGRHIEQLGVFDPTRNPPEFRYDEVRMTHWLSKGAQPSDTIRELLNREAKAKKAVKA